MANSQLVTLIPVSCPGNDVSLLDNLIDGTRRRIACSLDLQDFEQCN